MSNEFYRCTPREVAKYVEDIARAGLVSFVKSSPGMGKSAIMKMVAEKLNLTLIDHRLSTSAPEDMTGLPQFVDGYASFAPFRELFPLENTPVPKGRDGWMVFLDELTSAPRTVMAASYKLLLDRKIGQHNLHDQVILTSAGNKLTDNAIVNKMGTALESRVVHLEMEISFKEWLEDVALKENYDERIIGFLSMHNSYLMTFDPNHEDSTFCCPRTWEFVNRLLTITKINPKTSIPLLAGTISSGVAAAFVQYCAISHQMIRYEDVLAGPLTCRLPEDIPLKWATITHLMNAVGDSRIDDVCSYISRFTPDFQALFYRALLVRKPDFRSHAAFRRAMVNLSRELNG